MSVTKDIYSLATVPLIFAKKISKYIRGKSEDSVRVLLYHDIRACDYDHFRSQLRFLKKNYRFITPSEFSSYRAGNLELKGRNILLTFDDGFHSNRLVAEAILNPLGIKALFFIISDFVEMTDRHQAKRFIAEQVQPGRDINTIPDDLYNMSWQDVEALLAQGHTIGAHTKTHVSLATITEPEQLEEEIIASAERLERKSGQKIVDFAYPFGNLQSITPAAIAIARKRFNNIHNGLRGENFGTSARHLVNRDAMSPSDSLIHLYSFLNGGVDFRYLKDINTINQW
jgi:peptidoglycan/xylan/chitin deacetylase (PgdA/CDA1 family)